MAELRVNRSSQHIQRQWKALALIAEQPRSLRDLAKLLDCSRSQAWCDVRTLRSAGIPLEFSCDAAYRSRSLWRLRGVVPWQVRTVAEALKTMTPDARLEAMSPFCLRCGDEKRVLCHCANDE